MLRNDPTPPAQQSAALLLSVTYAAEETTCAIFTGGVD